MWKNYFRKKHYSLDHVMKVRIWYEVFWTKCRASKIKGRGHGAQKILSRESGDNLLWVVLQKPKYSKNQVSEKI